ncbi:hypothetical protein [Spiroplasma endosymbiont of Colias croceus]
MMLEKTYKLRCKCCCQYQIITYKEYVINKKICYQCRNKRSWDYG